MNDLNWELVEIYKVMHYKYKYVKIKWYKTEIENE